MKVLIVDDEPAVRLSLSRVFTSRGHEVKIAANGLEGLALWREWQPEAVLLDVIMPGLSGPAVLQELNSNLGAKVFLMSAYSADFDIQQLRAMGAKEFIAKPFPDIFAVVNKVEE